MKNWFLIVLVFAGLLYRFRWGMYSERKDESTTGEGETYLNKKDQLSAFYSALEKKEKKNIHIIEKKNGFDATFEDEDGYKTGFSLRKKKDDEDYPFLE